MLAIAFIVSQLTLTILGDLILGLYPFRLLGPLPNDKHCPRRVQEIHSWMGYPYFWMYLGIFTLKLPKQAFPPRRDIPLLYCYGGDKRVMFHTKTFMRRIAAEGDKGKGTKAVEFKHCGHWIHVQDPEGLEKEFNEFLGKE